MKTLELESDKFKNQHGGGVRGEYRKFYHS